MIVHRVRNSLFNLRAEIGIYPGKYRQRDRADHVVRRKFAGVAAAAIAIDYLSRVRALTDAVYFRTEQNWAFYRLVQCRWNAIHPAHRLEHGRLHVDHLVEHHAIKLVILE